MAGSASAFGFTSTIFGLGISLAKGWAGGAGVGLSCTIGFGAGAGDFFLAPRALAMLKGLAGAYGTTFLVKAY